jgi:CIC family chloride channel protein
MQAPKEIILHNESIESILDKFEKTDTAVLPVFKNGLFIGFIHKTMILEKYRSQLKEMVIE